SLRQNTRCQDYGCACLRLLLLPRCRRSPAYSRRIDRHQDNFNMKYLALILLAALTWVDPATVKKINETKSAAESSFKKGDYSAAIEKYRYLVDSLNVREDEVMLNVAHAYYLAK